MPVYRPNHHYLSQAVGSILTQTIRDLELIIVEDPSESSGADVIASFADPRVTYIRNAQRTSLTQQHNAGMHRARGEFICRFDADDISEPARLERELAFLSDHPDCDVVGTWLTIIDETDHVTGLRRYPTEHAEIVAAMRSFNPVANSSVMFRRELLERFGDRREEVLAAEDYDWYSKLAAGGARFATIPEFLIRYRLHGGSMKSTKLKQTIRHSLAVKRQYWLKEMSIRERAIMFAEQALLLLPDTVTLAAFRQLRYMRADRTGNAQAGR